MEPGLGLGYSGEAFDRWVRELQDAVSPPLSANRTMGSLGGLVASRIARELRIGGPSFSVSCDETSGTQALQIAALWLHRGELDAAVVGAVDLCGDAARARRRPCSRARSLPAKVPRRSRQRLDDALWDGDRVYAGCAGRRRQPAGRSATTNFLS